jgi:hypothetical protein
VAVTIWVGVAQAMKPARIAELRQETVDMFYHGFDNYMSVAFPEDEVNNYCIVYSMASNLYLVTSSVLRASHSRRTKPSQRGAQRCARKLFLNPD